MNLKVDSVVKYFGTRKILSDIHLSCSVGEIVGIFGRNGCGKSTLLKIIFGSSTAENAYVNIEGKTLTNRFQRSTKVSYLSQDSFLPVNMKVSTLLSLRKLESVDEDFIKKVKNQRIGQLSGGELRYLEILFVLNSQHKFVILDEPFNGLSPIMKETVKAEIVKFSKQKGIIITDHDYRNVLSITTKKYLMTQGVIKQVHSQEELVQANYLPFDS